MQKELFKKIVIKNSFQGCKSEQLSHLISLLLQLKRIYRVISAFFSFIMFLFDITFIHVWIYSIQT